MTNNFIYIYCGFLFSLLDFLFHLDITNFNLIISNFLSKINGFEILYVTGIILIHTLGYLYRLNYPILIYVTSNKYIVYYLSLRAKYQATSPTYKHRLKAAVPPLGPVWATVAIGSLNMLITHFNEGFTLINEGDGSDLLKLQTLQRMDEVGSTMIKDICSGSNEYIASTNNRQARKTEAYEMSFNEAKEVHDSQALNDSIIGVKRVRKEILEFHQKGVTNDDSYKDVNGQPKLKTRQNDFHSP